MALTKQPTLWGVPLKLISLVTLTAQNSSLILVMRYSRIMPAGPNGHYFTSTAVLLNELLKLAICLCVAIYTTPGHSIQTLYKDVFGPDAWKLSIPAVLYTLQNSLQYVAVSNLDAATFQVTYQLKIITTAFFSVALLRRSLSNMQWLSLFILTMGVALVQLPAAAVEAIVDSLRWSWWSGEEAKTVVTKVARDLVTRGPPTDTNSKVGLVAVILACCLSGLAGVYFEKVLKGSQTSLWTRNVQLSFFSLIPATVIGCWWYQGREIAEYGFFNGYNTTVWSAIILQALGGIVVALCVKFADNIAKNFATSISILISFVASVYLFEMEVTVNFVAGAALVVFATFLYSRPAPVPQELPKSN